MTPAVYSVHQINNYIKRMMDDDVFLSGFFVEAEISGLKEHSSGHMYFTLKDERASINAVMFRNHALGLEFKPESGLKVIAYGRVSAYEKTGAYQFYAELMQPLGLGGLFFAFTRLKEKLASEGLFDEARKKPIPRYPRCIGVVTSLNGAALRDIIAVAHRRNPRVKLLIAPCAVQGTGAAEEIAEAIRLLNTHGEADVIIAGRGGGSAEDLWAFNEEVVARAAAASLIPIVSAVGHETDFTILDFAADYRAPTPSAAAELCVPSAPELRGMVHGLAYRMTKAVNTLYSEYYSILSNLTASLPTPEELTNARTERLNTLVGRLNREISHKLRSWEDKVGASVQALALTAPLNVLKRGYAMLQINGHAVRSVKSALEAGYTPHSEMAVRLADGTIYGIITDIRNEDI